MNTSKSPLQRLRSSAIVCATLALLVPTSFAQAPKAAPAATPVRQLFSVTETVIKPDKVQEYERLIKEEVNPALKKAGYTARNTFTRGTFGDNYTYIAATPIENYARYDQPNPLSKAIGEDAYRALVAKLATCQVSSRTYAVRAMPAISHTTGADLDLAVITVREFAPGKKAEWVKFQQEEYLPALKTSNAKVHVHYETLYGGNINEVTTLSSIKDYAALDSPNLVSQKLGAEGYQKLMAKAPAGLVVRTDRWILRFRKELSIVPESGAPKK